MKHLPYFDAYESSEQESANVNLHRRSGIKSLLLTNWKREMVDNHLENGPGEYIELREGNILCSIYDIWSGSRTLDTWNILMSLKLIYFCKQDRTFTTYFKYTNVVASS